MIKFLLFKLPLSLFYNTLSFHHLSYSYCFFYIHLPTSSSEFYIKGTSESGSRRVISSPKTKKVTRIMNNRQSARRGILEKDYVSGRTSRCGNSCCGRCNRLLRYSYLVSAVGQL